MEIYFTENAKKHLNNLIEEYKIPEDDRYIELTIIKPNPDEVQYILMDVQEEDWNRITIGKTHNIYIIEDLACEVLIRKSQLKYFDELTVDYREINGKFAFTFIPNIDKLK